MIRLQDTAGELHPLARLKAAQVREIRRRRKRGERADALASEFGLSVDYVRKICRRIAWRSLV